MYGLFLLCGRAGRGLVAVVLAVVGGVEEVQAAGGTLKAPLNDIDIRKKKNTNIFIDINILSILIFSKKC